MDFQTAVITCLKNYAVLRGRASRSEYWWWALACAVLNFLLQIVAATGGVLGLVAAIAGLALLLPTVSVGVRRLHDIDRSGWWYLLSFVPVIGWLLLLYWAVQKGTSGANRFGPDPLGI